MRASKTNELLSNPSSSTMAATVLKDPSKAHLSAHGPLDPLLIPSYFPILPLSDFRSAFLISLFYSYHSFSRNVFGQPCKKVIEKTRAGYRLISSQIDVDEILESVRNNPHDARRKGHSLSALIHTTPYSSRYATSQEISKFRIPKQGAPADAVYQLIRDEMDLDGKPQLNLARSRPRVSHLASIADLGQAL